MGFAQLWTVLENPLQPGPSVQQGMRIVKMYEVSPQPSFRLLLLLLVCPSQCVTSTL